MCSISLVYFYYQLYTESKSIWGIWSQIKHLTKIDFTCWLLLLTGFSSVLPQQVLSRGGITGGQGAETALQGPSRPRSPGWTQAWLPGSSLGGAGGQDWRFSSVSGQPGS